jgi:acyl carrier protein
MSSRLAAIRDILAKHGRLSTDVLELEAESSLYQAGLTSLATVGVMLALEEHFNVEFPRSMLSRKTFESMESIASAVGELLGHDQVTLAAGASHHAACR